MSRTTGISCVRVTCAGRYFASVGGRLNRRYGPMRSTAAAAQADVEALRCGRAAGHGNPAPSDRCWTTCSATVKADTLRQLAERFAEQVPALESAVQHARRRQQRAVVEAELRAALAAIAEAQQWADELAVTS